MSSSEQAGVRLTVSTADPATEIFVLDARFHLATRGIGRLDEQLPPGLYMVRARSGPEISEEVVLLPANASGPVHVPIGAISFGSPAPLANTGKTHEYHIALARDVSQTVQVSAGAGSRIFVLARDWRRPDGASAGEPAPSPMRGLSIRALNGSLVADLDAAAVKVLDAPDPCAACSVDVNPGAYRLILEAAPGLTVEQTIVASPGWQTQVFLLQHDYAPEPEWRRADVVGASILMTTGTGFEENREEPRLAEMARLALRDGRRVLSDDLRQMLHDKFSDPMLGIFGAHLLLREREVDEELYRIVVSNLRALLGEHPDVQALSLRLRDGANLAPFTAPPMLRHSWEMMLDATVMHPELVPPDSLLESIAPRIWGEGPWLLWMQRSGEDLANDLSQIASSMAVQFGGVIEQASGHAHTTRSVPTVIYESTTETPDSASGASEGTFTTSDPTIGETGGYTNATASGAWGDVSFAIPGDDAGVQDSTSAEAATVALDEETVTNLVRSLGVPRSTIEKMLGGA